VLTILLLQLILFFMFDFFHLLLMGHLLLLSS
jgi:hypothetical protein